MWRLSPQRFVPAVGSSVGANCEIIRDFENGLLAATPGEFHAKLAALLDDEWLRERLGRAGRVTVEQRYSLAVRAPQFCAVLERAARRAAEKTLCAESPEYSS